MTQLNLPGGQCHYLNRAVSDIDGLQLKGVFCKKPMACGYPKRSGSQPTLDWLRRILVVDAACVAKGPPRTIKNSRKPIPLDTRDLCGIIPPVSATHWMSLYRNNNGFESNYVSA